MVIIKTPDCDSQYTEASHKERGKDSQEQKKVRSTIQNQEAYLVAKKLKHTTLILGYELTWMSSIS